MASQIKVDTISEKTSANGVTIDSVSLKDGKVATANSIDSDAYVDGSIDTAHIADDQITLAKMASGTDGNIISYDASGNPVAIATGSDGQVLTSTGAGSPPAFEAAPGGGKVGQVVSTTVTAATASTTSATYADITGMTLDITPAATSSKILVMFDINIGGQTGYSAKAQLVRDSTVIAVGAAASSRTVCSVDLRNTNDQAMMIERSMSFLDSPSTTSAVTYKLQWMETENTTLYLNRSYQDTDTSNFGRAASTITAIEVLA